ncbi:MAG: fumarylacetoacetate hydrolase, partial [Desulfobacteraceae bacterium]|nr:fumarylacetoacetate hydrolase [Desulfobacteraceae bacterium]
MRLIRFGEKGKEIPGLWKNGNIVNLRDHFPDIPDIGERFFGKGGWKKLQISMNPGQAMDVRLGAPIASPSKIICL